MQAGYESDIAVAADAADVEVGDRRYIEITAASQRSAGTEGDRVGAKVGIWSELRLADAGGSYGRARIQFGRCKWIRLALGRSVATGDRLPAMGRESFSLVTKGNMLLQSSFLGAAYSLCLARGSMALNDRGDLPRICLKRFEKWASSLKPRV